MNDDSSMKDDRWKRYEELRDAALDGRLADSEMEVLESFVLNDAAMRRDYTEHVHQQAALRLSVSEIVPAVLHLGKGEESPVTEVGSVFGESRWRRTIMYAISIAAVTLLVVGLTHFLAVDGSSNQIAMITSAEDCRWGDCTLTTAERLPLGTGILRLESGIATLRFSKVNVTLEGQAELEIVDSKTCFVHSGRVFANVEPGGEGFIIQTPTATFIDRGTTFGVKVGPQGTSDLTVFKGRVDVSHRSTSNESSCASQ